jgi:hypothetical protein
MRRFKKFFTPSRTSPKGGRRACLCEDNTYSIKCCDGSLRAQGIGSTTKQFNYLLQENTSFILQENNNKIIL